jgi:hypothetical protein
MNPAIINISSALDWTSNVAVLLAQLDWHDIRNRVAHTIAHPQYILQARQQESRDAHGFSIP